MSHRRGRRYRISKRSTELRLRAGAFTVRDEDARLRLGVVVEPAEPGVSFTSAGAILMAGDGQVVSHWFAKDPSERPLLGALAAEAGSYRLRVAAIDSSQARGGETGRVFRTLRKVAR